ncbi:MAG: RecX family transcriptional regulator [Clostridia bacterium]|nr:RecX family transcriptional regulator [Clostridia bacterium]
MKADNYNPKKLTAELVLDGKIVFLSQEAAITMGLDLKKDLPDEVVPALVAESERLLCKKYLYDQIAKYYKTKRGYYTKLLQKGFSKAAADYAVKCAEESGYIDDEKFSASYVEQNASRKGAYRIKKELLSKGVPSDVADRAVAELETDPDDLYRVAKKLVKGDLSTPEERQKLYRKLASRGFSYGEISQVVSVLKREYEFDDFDD